MDASQDTNKKQENAVKTLIRAVTIAQSKGVYTLEEASIINDACKCFMVNASSVSNTNNQDKGD